MGYTMFSTFALHLAAPGAVVRDPVRALAAPEARNSTAPPPGIQTTCDCPLRHTKAVATAAAAATTIPESMLLAGGSVLYIEHRYTKSADRTRSATVAN